MWNLRISYLVDREICEGREATNLEPDHNKQEAKQATRRRCHGLYLSSFSANKIKDLTRRERREQILKQRKL